MFSALFLAKVCDVLSVRGGEGGSWDVKSGSRGFQSDTAKILPIRDLFFLILVLHFVELFFLSLIH